VNIVGDEDHRLPHLHEAADDVEVLEAGLEVEAAGGLVQQECIRIVDQRAPEQEPTLFTGGHGGEAAVFQFRHPELLHDVLGAGAVVGAELLMRPGVCARIVARQNDAQAAHVAPILVLKVVRDDAEVSPQVEDVPALLAEDAYRTALALDGIDVARQQLEQGRFTGAVGSEDGGLASGCDVERQVVEDEGAPTIGGDVLDLDDVLHGCGSYLDWGCGAAMRVVMEAAYAPGTCGCRSWTSMSVRASSHPYATSLTSTPPVISSLSRTGWPPSAS
jgi:hypothetical protein